MMLQKFLAYHLDRHMKQQTLYTIIRRDTSVRYDFAIRLASVLGIDNE